MTITTDKWGNIFDGMELLMKICKIEEIDMTDTGGPIIDIRWWKDEDFYNYWREK